MSERDRTAGALLHLNPTVRGLRPSATVAINERSNALRRTGRRIYKLGLGQSPFPVPEPVAQVLRENAHQKDYLPVQGLPELRREVARTHRLAFDVPCDEEDVLIGPGSKELMFLLQTTTQSELLLPSPAWVSYAPQARILDRPVCWLPTTADGGWKLAPETLEAHCRRDPNRSRLLILNYPCNPTAATYAEAELAELAETATRYGILLLSDEIYSRLSFEEHASIVPHYPEGTIFSSGLSKWCGAGGWRLGIFVFPRALRELLAAMVSVASETYTSVSAPIQYAAVRAYAGGEEIEQYLEGSRRVLKALGHDLVERLCAGGAEVHAPEGGFYLFPDFSPLAERLAARGIRTDEQLCERLLEETGVAILPGSDFGCSPEDLIARLAYVDFDGRAALKAAADLPADASLDEAFLRAQCGDVLEAIDRVCDWLSIERESVQG